MGEGDVGHMVPAGLSRVFLAEPREVVFIAVARTA
ncbi:Hypothetical protein SLIV_32113 [Streptomyces lividans TK24]|uniref:Secreted protein n=1 Tax=Streptomyces lividans TK24 TaxID=457428 RepID=A0ABX6TPJ3_STRLI|nr:Hypothetical protein SLIV_32113 [Streptomyces lividans TK24]QSJ12915.1 Hypothetical protein SLIVDG2_32113 [Streptomyces lividans]QTD73825.1 Hypothetical protein SLIVYQS_32113 [Streptomyces lividans TK24] [Streptomyces lividans]